MKHTNAIVQSKILFFLAWRNLVYKKMRTMLTIIGIVIGVGAIFFLLSFGIGVQQLVTNRVIGDQSVKSIDITTSNSKVVSLGTDNYRKIKDLPHIVKIGTLYSYAGVVTSAGGKFDAIVYGADQGYLDLTHLVLVAGKPLDFGSNKSMVISTTLAKALGYNDPAKAIAKTITLSIPALTVHSESYTRSFQISGVSNDSDGNELYVPLDILTAAGATDYSQIKVEAEDVSDVPGLRSQIETLGLQTQSPVDTIDQINQVFQFFNIILVGFGAIGMAVAILGMFNTLTISLLERTREIGLMVALGGRDRDMRKLFIFEAMLLSFIGALLGILLAVVSGQAVNLVMNAFAKHRGVTEGFQLFATPWWLVLGAILFMVVIGLLVVLIPARQASRINPIEALRRE